MGTDEPETNNLEITDIDNFQNKFCPASLLKKHVGEEPSPPIKDAVRY